MQRDDHGKTVRIDLLVDVETGLPVRRDSAAAVQGAKPAAPATLPVCCRALLQSLYDAAILCDVNGQIIEFNNRALDFLRYDYDEFCKLAIFDLVSGTSAQLLATIQANLQKQQFTLIQAYQAELGVKIEDQKFNAWVCARTPAGRGADPSELVGAAVFLASRASDFVNGQIIYVDGGMLAVL